MKASALRKDARVWTTSANHDTFPDGNVRAGEGWDLGAPHGGRDASPGACSGERWTAEIGARHPARRSEGHDDYGRAARVAFLPAASRLPHPRVQRRQCGILVEWRRVWI